MIEEPNNNGVHHEGADGQQGNGGGKPSIDDLIENLFRKELIVKLEKLEHENSEQVKSLNGFTTSVQEMLTFAQHLAEEEKAREKKEKEAKEAKEAREKEHPPVAHHKPEHKEPKEGHKEIKEHPSPSTEKKGPRGMSKVQSEAIFKTKKAGEAKDVGDKKKGGLATIDEVSQSVILSKGESHASGKKSKEEGDPVSKQIPLVKPKPTKPLNNKATPRPTVADKAKGKDEESKEEEEKKDSGKKTDEKKRPQTSKVVKPAHDKEKDTKEPHKKPAEKKDEEEEKKQEGKKESKRPVTAKPPKKEGDNADKKDEKKEEKKPAEKKEIATKPAKEPKEKPAKEEKKGKDEKKEDKKPGGKEAKDSKEAKKPAKEEKKSAKGKEEKPADKAAEKTEVKAEETKTEEKKEETIPEETKPEEKKEEPKLEEKKEELPAPAPTIPSEVKPQEETPAETQHEPKKEENKPEVLDINGHSPAKQAEEQKDKSPDNKSPSKMRDSLDSINQFNAEKKPEEKPVTSIPESPSAQEINNINDAAPAPVIAPVEVKRFQPLNEEQQNSIRDLWRQIKVPGLKLNPDDPEDRVHEVGERLLQECKENLAECETRIQNLSKDINFDQPEEAFQFAMLTTAGLDVIEPMFVNELQGKSPIDPTVLRLLKIFMIIMGENVVEAPLEENFWKSRVIPFLEQLKENIGTLKNNLQSKTNLPFESKYEIERLVQQNPGVLKVTIYENIDAFCGFISFGILELCERYGVVNAQDFDDDKTGRQNNRAIVGYLRDKCEFYKQNIAKLAPLV